MRFIEIEKVGTVVLLFPLSLLLSPLSPPELPPLPELLPPEVPPLPPPFPGLIITVVEFPPGVTIIGCVTKKIIIRN